LERVDTR